LTVSAAGTAEAGDRLTVADITLPSGVSLADADEAELTIASIIDPVAEAAKAEAAEKAAAEAEKAAQPAAEEEPAATTEAETGTEEKPADAEAKTE
jgi:glutathione S-transferase